MSYDAGALVFKIQTDGAQAFQSDMRNAGTAIEGVERASTKTKGAAEGLGRSTDDVADKARKAKAPLDDQAKSTKGAGDESETAARKQRQQKQASEEQAQAAQKVGAALLIAGAAVASGVALAVAKFADFDQAMSNVQAATGETSSNMGQLRDAAIEAGSETVFSATEAAGAIEELSKAGVKTADILAGALSGSLDLAAAGQLGVARAAEITSTALNQFGLTGNQASHVADVLAAGAGKAMGSVEDLANGLKFVGPVASAMGVSLEETVGVMSLFADQGILGEQAGTSLRSVLLSLTSPSKEARAEIERLGIKVYDSAGNFLGLQNAAGELSRAYTNMDGASRDASLGILFGNESITAATALYRAGADGVDRATKSVNDFGYAGEQAAARLDNLSGDVEALGGAFDSALIKTGSGANDALRTLVQIVTEAVNGFSDLPEPLQQTALFLGAAAAGVGLVGGAALVTIPKIAEMRTSLDTLGVTGDRTRAGLGRLVGFIGGPWGVAMLAATAATVAFNTEIDRGVPSQQKIANAAQQSASAMDMLQAAAERGGLEKNLFGDYAAQLENLPGLLDRASEAGWRWAELSFNEQGALDSVKRLGDALGEMAGSNLPAAQNAFRKLTTEFGLTDAQASQLLNEMPALKDALLEQATAAGIVADDQTLLQLALGETSTATDESAGTSKTAAGAYLEAANGASTFEQELNGLIDKIMEANGFGQDAVTTNARWQESLAGISGEVQRQRDEYEKANGTLDGFTLSLDQNTLSGSANAAALAAVASDAQAAAAAQFEVDKSTVGAKTAADNYAGTLAAQRTAFEDAARSAGYNADEVYRLAEEVFGLPEERIVELLAETGVAAQKASDFRNLWESIKNKTVTLTTIGSTLINGGTAPAVGPVLRQADGGNVQFFAGGGRYGENHVAQFARAGTYRVWAEDETQGEWYLPNSPAKRDRSLVIAQQMLDEWGFDMVPKGATGAGPATPGGGAASPTIYVQNPFTGEYLLAQVATVADGRISEARYQSARNLSGGTSSR